MRTATLQDGEGRPGINLERYPCCLCRIVNPSKLGQCGRQKAEVRRIVAVLASRVVKNLDGAFDFAGCIEGHAEAAEEQVPE